MALCFALIGKYCLLDWTVRNREAERGTAGMPFSCCINGRESRSYKQDESVPMFPFKSRHRAGGEGGLVVENEGRQTGGGALVAPVGGT